MQRREGSQEHVCACVCVPVCLGDHNECAMTSAHRGRGQGFQLESKKNLKFGGLIFLC